VNRKLRSNTIGDRVLAGIAGPVGGEKEKRCFADIFRHRDRGLEQARGSSIVQTEFFGSAVSMNPLSPDFQLV
jgi:hypothetical protein